MRRRTGEIQPVDDRVGPPEPWHGAKHELLVDGRGAAVHGAAEEVRVGQFEIARRLHVARSDRGGEARRVPLDDLLDAPYVSEDHRRAQRSLLGQVRVAPRRLTVAYTHL